MLLTVAAIAAIRSGTERADERPIATLAEVEALATAMPEHFKLVVLLATWCQLRRGELLGLRRRDVDELQTTVSIDQSRTFTSKGRSLVKAPKSAAGRRVLAVSPNVVTAIKEHLDAFTAPEPDVLVFHRQDWRAALAGRLAEGMEDSSIDSRSDRSSSARLCRHRPNHDLRHTGLTLAGATGATTAELMHRAGHASANAALRYQHATKDRDRVLADALAELVKPAEIVLIDAKNPRSIAPQSRPKLITL